MRYPNVTFFYLFTTTSYTYYKIQKRNRKQTVKKCYENDEIYAWWNQTRSWIWQ